MRHQAWAGAAALDRSGWQRELSEGLAAGTGHARAGDPVHHEPVGNILQLFGHILTEAAKGSTAARTVLVAGGQLDLLARDVIGDGTALRLVFSSSSGSRSFAVILAIEISVAPSAS